MSLKFRPPAVHIATGALLLVATACSGAAQPLPSAQAAKPSTSAAAGASATASAKPAASSPSTTSPLASPASWAQVLSAAKPEGQVVVTSQAGSVVAEQLTQTFMKAYPDIKVDFTGAGGSETDTRIITERQAGKFTTDLAVQGTTTLFTFVGASALDPLAPYLVGPQTQELSKWLGGKYTYADEAGK